MKNSLQRKITVEKRGRSFRRRKGDEGKVAGGGGGGGDGGGGGGCTDHQSNSCRHFSSKF